MAVVATHQFAQCITCHVWSPDQTMVAFCPNNNEVHIYKLIQDKWERAHVLQKHDQLISAIDWSSRTNKIVTASHDRNSYVWNQEGAEWLPTLVILRLNRAALCVKWSSAENKFAVGSGAKTVCVCYYEKDNDWWVSKLIRKKHSSSVTSVAWHPDNILLATTSTDGKCRIFSTFIKGVDTRDSGTSIPDSKFGEGLEYTKNFKFTYRAHPGGDRLDVVWFHLFSYPTWYYGPMVLFLEYGMGLDPLPRSKQIVQLDLSSTWAFGVKWSPSGNTLAYTGQSSMVYFVDDIGPSPVAQSVAFRDLPLRDVLFISERMVVAVGYDCNPMVFTADERGIWSFVRFLDERKLAPSGSKYGSQFTEAFGKFYGQSKQMGSDTVDPTRARGGAHENCITCILPLRSEGVTVVKRFSTSGLDGRIVVWELDSD